MREFDLLEHVFTFNRRLPGHVTIPPGDDMGAFRAGGEDVLVTVDQIADGVHVTLASTPLEQVARKAIVRNLSDVAAMAAVPRAAVAAACLPRDFGEARANRLFDAMRAIAEEYGCPLIGGDISVWDHPLILSVTIFASPEGVPPIRRSGALAGDLVCVTGQLGGAWDQQGGGPHLTAEPRIGLARALAKRLGSSLHSMIDLSDGLGQDLGHICRQSKVHAEIDLDRLPLRDHALAAAERDGRPAWLHGLSDGEDYELCFTVAPEAASALPQQLEKIPIRTVGRILPIDVESTVSKPSVWLVHPDGQRELFKGKGWEHTGS